MRFVLRFVFMWRPPRPAHVVARDPEVSNACAAAGAVESLRARDAQLHHSSVRARGSLEGPVRNRAEVKRARCDR
jgi:hypothetical protein